MRREGRQHGMVRTSRILSSPWNSKPVPRSIQRLDSPLSAGLFTEVSKKPTNHSKFTGRCGKPRCLGCRMHPACKAKNKTKGSHKLRSSDMTTNSRLITWSVVHGRGRPGLKFLGFSATSVLNHLYNDIGDCCKDNDDHDDDDGLEVNSRSLKEIKNNEGENTHENIDDDGENIEFVFNQDVEEEGWYMVGEI
ncbi:hypothetical protein HRI_004553000 [Hibiscus trionum]|uniref:Uncharacterized protein n=1 Tax=Hibiscus trionum TaxID=183268 RepID=A0A9W7J644_HIBTR|nr:hypothetical protein HRI_004553000 [Hibiscus trionum]